MTKEVFVSDLTKPGAPTKFETLLQVQRKDLRKKKAGGAYLAMRLGDRTGWLDARLWDNAEAIAEVFEEKDFVRVKGRIHEYNGQLQISVHRLRPVAPAHLDVGDFLPCTDRDIQEMYAELLDAIAGFRDPHLKSLMEGIFQDPDIRARFQRGAAASGMHHAKVGGLLEHVVSCLRMAKLVASHYQQIDNDLLASGVLLHDFGKIFEISVERTIEYTDEGRLLGHIAMGSSWIERKCDEIEGFPPRLKVLLLHMVLSHHGKLEFGSPREPLFPEALALHYIDDLDSRLDMMREVTGQISSGVWSQRHRGLRRNVLDRSAYLKAGRPPAAEAVATEGGDTGPSKGGRAEGDRPAPPLQPPAAALPDSPGFPAHAGLFPAPRTAEGIAD